MRHAIVKDGAVANIIEALPEFGVSIGAIACPENCDFGWLYNGSTFVAPTPPAVNLPAEKQKLVDHIDNTVASIVGRFTRFQSEYVAREAAARAFVASGYSGEPGIWVTSFAQPAGITNTAAADLIISQADALRGALQALGAARMAKYNVLNAFDLPGAMSAHAAIMATITAIAAAL